MHRLHCRARRADSLARWATPDEAIDLSWDGESFAAQTTESFLGMPVTVPGDRAERTLTVRNDGPSAGTFTATITDVELLETAGGTPDTFYDDVTIEWPDGSASLADLAADDETTIEELELARGEIATITIGYDFPAEATSGNSSEVGARSAAFDVTLALAGETPAADDGDGLAVTGGAPALWLAIVGAALDPPRPRAQQIPPRRTTAPLTRITRSAPSPSGAGLVMNQSPSERTLATSARLASPSLRSTLDTWKRAVACEMNSVSAI